MDMNANSITTSAGMAFLMIAGEYQGILFIEDDLQARIKTCACNPYSAIKTFKEMEQLPGIQPLEAKV
jgi:hypothetical protein